MPENSTPMPGDVGDDIDLLRAENDALRARLSRRATLRKWLSVLLVVLTSLTVVSATLAYWAHEKVFDTDSFMETVEPVLTDPAFYAAISARVSEQTLEALDIEERVTGALTQLDEYISEALLDALEIGERGREVLGRFDRPTLANLAPAIASGLETRVVAIIDRFVTSEQFSSRLPDLVRRAHQGTIALVRGDLVEIPNVSIAEGEVSLNLLPIVAEILRPIAEQIRGFGPDITLPDVISNQVDEARDQLAAALQARLPEDFGLVTIMSEERLVEIQETANRLDRLVWALVILSLVLAGVTVAVSPTRRRTLVQLALGVAAGLVIAMVIMRRVQQAVFDQITSPDGERVARVLLTEVMSSLRTVVVIVGVAAIVLAIAAYLAGGPRWLDAVSTRVSSLRSDEDDELGRWVSSHHDVLRIVGIGVAVAVVFITGLELIPILIVAVILGLYLWGIAAVSRSDAEEVPEILSPAGSGMTNEQGEK